MPMKLCGLTCGLALLRSSSVNGAVPDLHVLVGTSDHANAADDSICALKGDAEVVAQNIALKAFGTVHFAAAFAPRPEGDLIRGESRKHHSQTTCASTR